MEQLKEMVSKDIAEAKEKIIGWRRDFHMHPEVSFAEYRTAEIIANEMKRLGLKTETGVGHETGVTALLMVDESYPTIAFRADIDALGVTECAEDGREYASKNPGVFHGCGHDGHTASLMGAANILVKRKDLLKTNVKFIFQPGEEMPPGGAKGMIDAGCLEGVDAVYGGHLNSPLTVGNCKCVRGWSLSTISLFKVTLKGKGTHTGYPHQGIDTTLLAAHLTVNFQSIVSRMMDPVEPKNISVMQIHVGEQDVTTPDTGYVSGSYCTVNWPQTDRLENEMRRVLKATCDMFGATGEIEFQRGYPALVNDVEHADFVRGILNDTMPGGVTEAKGTLGAEDFAYYLTERPGAFYFIGAMNPEKGINYPHHHPCFDIDEEALMYMTQTHVLIALLYDDFRLKKEGENK